ncbi:MAG: 3-phosphoshikimate 1-carboxyvinyltransferase [Acidobacteriota bacterium]|nr:3-phosphoshikimate 1-carboxyvinyltransferase [Acidobacteriota bacterium]
MDAKVQPAKQIRGSVRTAGDKSVSHRYAMLAGLAAGTSEFDNFSTSADCSSTLSCMVAMGAHVRRNGNHVEVEGVGGKLAAPQEELDCGNSGSTMRMLSGVVAAQPFTSVMVGDASLSRRPMKRVIEPLTQMGARIDAEEGCAPLTIHGSRLKAITYQPPVASAQVKSCVLLAGLFAEGETTVIEPVKTRDHTELAIEAFGGEVVRSGDRISVRGGQVLKAIKAYVPGDLSSVVFFLCATALYPGSSLVVDSVLLNPTRSVVLDVLGGMGVKINFLKIEQQFGELVGTLQAEGSVFQGGVISGATSAALIDELPAIAAIAPYSVNGVEIRNAQELRVKECDRIHAVVRNLRAMGAEVEEFPDGMKIPGQQKLHGAAIESFDDHRIAMAFAIAALRAEGETTIHNAEAVKVSFPEFFQALEKVRQ